MAFCPVCRSDFPDDWRKCPKDDVVLLASDSIGKYRILGMIGAGGMGAVYRAENPDTKATVAIKLLHPNVSGLDNARERFRREAATVAKLSTRHVVTIHDFGNDNRETLYLIMELLAGHPLRDEIRDGRVPLPRVGLIFDHALRGLSSAHNAGVTHRDLKPENIFVASTDDGEVGKLLDFGIARDASAHTGLTGSGTLMGTPGYMAPEQITASRGKVGPQTDVYAMGVILYEMLTANSPFGADSVSSVLGRILEREFVPLREVRDDLPDSVYALIERAMSGEPDERFASAVEMLQAWKQAWSDFDQDIRTGPLPGFEGKRQIVKPDGGVDPHSDTDIVASAKTAAATPAPPDQKTPELADTAQLYDSDDDPEEDDDGPRPSWLMPAAVAGIVIVVGAVFAVGKWPGKPTAAVTADAAAPPVPADAQSIAETDAGPPKVDGMVYFAGGTVELGTPDGLKDRAAPRPPGTSEVGPFYIDKYEVTAAGSKLPMTGVTYQQAAKICAKRGKRLPTEAEWELVARSDKLDPEGACLKDDDQSQPVPVGTHPDDCTSHGVCDLVGNVSEWVADGWLDQGDPETKAVIRGAAYNVRYVPNGFYSSVFSRVHVDRRLTDAALGFRCARSP
ncbi:MAG: protein kinase [Deltaproteobacteria bacterium]|nr:protein kinase [Deltaproteobacteria bacterium]